MFQRLEQRHHCAETTGQRQIGTIAALPNAERMLETVFFPGNDSRRGHRVRYNI